MTIQQKYVPYSPQQRVVGDVGPGLDLAFHIEVPATAKAGAVGSVSVYDYGSAPFNASVTAAPTNDNHSGQYALVERTIYFQIATNPPGPNIHPGMYQVGAGEAMFINISIAHDGKTGGGNWTGPRQVAAECRAAQ